MGPTSHDVILTVRRFSGERRVGHSGTLDPFASGLLLIFLGRGTRLIRFLEPLVKTYTGTIRLGSTTDTLDSTGTVTREAVVPELNPEAISTAMSRFVGRIDQVPPAYSAKKIDGVASYRRARRGEQVQLAPVPVTIHEFDLTKVDGGDIDFRAVVGSGTYLRSLARDLGAELGTVAHLTALRRTAIGEFAVDEACPPGEIDLSAARPLVEALKHVASHALSGSERSEILHGRALPVEVDANGPVALTFDGELVAVAEAIDDRLQPRVVVQG